MGGLQKGLSGLVGRSIIFVPFALAEVGRELFKDETAAAGQTVIQSWLSAGLIQPVPHNPAQMCPSVNAIRQMKTR